MQIECWLYARISDDPREQRRGVHRQLQDLRVHAQAKNWLVKGEFHDNDISAHKEEERPGYDKLMHAVITAMPEVGETGNQGVVLALHPSRLWRRRVERAQAIEDLRHAKACVAFETGGFFDMSKATERSQLAQVGESDTLESEVKGERVAREALARAEEGRANGAVQYGWRRVYEYDRAGRVESFRDEIDPEQAEIVKEVTNRLLAGETLFRITDDLNIRRVLPPGANLVMKRKKRAQGNEDGALWNKTSVKKLALRPANAGLRVHHGELYPAAWEPIVDREKWEQVKSLLTAPGRSVRRDGQRKHLLTWGIGECGVCTSVLAAKPRGRAKKLLYVCDSKQGCTGRNEELVDTWVGAVVVARLSRPDAAAVFGPDEERLTRLRVAQDGLKTRLEEAADDYADGMLTRDQLRAVTKKLKEQIARLEEEIEGATPKWDLELMGDLLGPPQEAVEAAWEALTVVQKRAVLEVLGIKVRILPTPKRGPGFDPDYVEVLAGDGTPFAEYVPAA
ncbi:recombinase family protein [Streptomyces ortus]|uniref:Recombinase family protein n=1 Tax=Streptomyces ortus TaxID=2867268 RepID=A0ABT3UZ02_9ACTN|nr:recombinase family protein [Streptomyces ortus]MCX4232824.1 recombinase family protein [Streptomyces ortus]